MGWRVPKALAGGESEEAGDGLLAVHVFVTVKEGCEEAFIDASINNASNSVKEEGVARFDVIQQKDDPKKFCLVEVYKNSDAPAKHKETEHYKTWRDAVADMMEVARSNIKYNTFFPKQSLNWSS